MTWKKEGRKERFQKRKIICWYKEAKNVYRKSIEETTTPSTIEERYLTINDIVKEIRSKRKKEIEDND